MLVITVEIINFCALLGRFLLKPITPTSLFITTITTFITTFHRLFTVGGHIVEAHAGDGDGGDGEAAAAARRSRLQLVQTHLETVIKICRKINSSFNTDTTWVSTK